MHLAIVIASIVGVAFSAGVVFHLRVTSEAQKVREHVSAAESRIRGDINAVLVKLATKV